MNLEPEEIRILGCLLEKERLTPENYPLSLNSLTNACNQSTNRDPLVDFSEKLVEQALFAMREKKVAIVVFGAGSRVQKYRHNLLDLFTLSGQETALIYVLLLRGPQTVGELRGRTERMTQWQSLEETEQVLTGLTQGDEPLVQRLAMRSGQKEVRYIHLLGASPGETIPTPVANIIPSGPSRVDRLELELVALRQEFDAFKKQFEG